MAEAKAEGGHGEGSTRAGAHGGRPGEPRPEDLSPGTLPVPALLLLVALAAGVVAQGAYYPDGQRVMVAVLVAALMAALWTCRWSGADAALAPLRAAGVLAVWAVVSAAVAGRVAAAGSTVLLLAGFVIVLLVCRRTTPAQRETLVGGAVAVGVLAAATGWVGVAWRVMPWALEDGGLWRAATLLTYANATAGLLTPLALVAVARLTRDRRAPAAVVCTCLLLVGVGATLSRAGLFALLVGAGVLAVMLGVRQVLATVAAPAAGAAVALVGLSPSMPADLPARPLVAVLALVAGLITAVALARMADRRLWLAFPFVALLALVSLVPPLPTSEALPAIGAPRLSLASPDRTKETRAALDVVADRPITGAGPGQSVLAWAGPDGTILLARYAHNEYLQMAADLGLVGLGLVIVLLATIAAVVWRGRTLALAPGLWAGAAAGLAALALHSAFDFLWHIPVIPLVGALLVGVTLPQPSETTREN